MNAGIVRCVAGLAALAAVAAEAGQLERAVRLHAAATRFGTTSGVVLAEADRVEALS